MKNYHIVMSGATDLDDFEKNAAEGLSPRHGLVVLRDRLNAQIHQAASRPGRVSPADKLRTRLIGTPQSWALARELAARLGPDDVIYCVDESSGIPMASALHGKADRPKLAVSLTNMDRPRGWLTGRLLRFANSVDVFLACCRTQFEFLRKTVGVAEERMCLVLAHLDESFFTPGPATPGKTRPVIAAAGMEKRDYRTLAEATKDLDADVKISAWSRDAAPLAKSFPPELPANMARQGYLEYPELRQLYRDADVVVVSVFPCTYAAGVTSMMEGMACARPVVVTRTRGLDDHLIPPDGLSIIEPGDPAAMRAAIERLLRDPQEARTLAEAGHSAGVRRFAFNTHLETVAGRLAAL
jgi:glycosyltransferase involved in cell wall biosynthesis